MATEAVGKQETSGDDADDDVKAASILYTCPMSSAGADLGTGVKSVCGRRSNMEDAVSVVPKFISLPFCCCLSRANLCTDWPCKAASSNLHFFGVYDGHGGAEAANHCREHLHLALAEELRERLKFCKECAPLSVSAEPSGHSSSHAHTLKEEMAMSDCSSLRRSSTSDSSSWPSTSSSDSGSMSSSGMFSAPSSAGVERTCAKDMEETWEDVWWRAMNACFGRMDREVGSSELGGVAERLNVDNSGTESYSLPNTVGSTAIVAVVTCCQIIVANCGDSRAILCRGGKAIALSTDHKPEREDELARIEAAGGRVICWNGYRVLGVLAMSRAIGDYFLKPFVIAEPEVTCTQRSDEDECLILASDGLWDVLSNEDVCRIARRCLSHYRHHHPHSAPIDGAAQAVASVLVNTAHDRGSTDNISVVVVDLQKRRPSSS